MTRSSHELCRIQHHRNLYGHLGNRARLYERQEMTLDELISAIERLQSIYDRMDNEDQREAKQFVRWAIKHLADKVWSAAL